MLLTNKKCKFSNTWIDPLKALDSQYTFDLEVVGELEVGFDISPANIFPLALMV